MAGSLGGDDDDDDDDSSSATDGRARDWYEECEEEEDDEGVNSDNQYLICDDDHESDCVRTARNEKGPDNYVIHSNSSPPVRKDRGHGLERSGSNTSRACGAAARAAHLDETRVPVPAGMLLRQVLQLILKLYFPVLGHLKTGVTLLQ